MTNQLSSKDNHKHNEEYENKEDIEKEIKFRMSWKGIIYTLLKKWFR